MGKKVEKSVSKERQPNPAGRTEETDLNKTTEPYKCNGNFLVDFTELCKQRQMTYIPSVITRPKLQILQSIVTSDSKLDKKADKKQAAVISETEHDSEINEAVFEGPPKTYTIRDKFSFFKPSVQVELDNNDKWDTVTELSVKGWKVDEPMMDVFQHSWIHLSKLHTVNFWNVGLTEETLHTLAIFLPHCANVKNLILDGNTGPQQNWSELIGEKSLIQNLSLRYCNITDNGAAEMAKLLGTAKYANTKLISLNLSGNLIGDYGAAQLAEGLRINRTLLSLTLTNNNIGDQGAIKISEALSRFPLTHEEVVMRRKMMSDKGSIERKSPLPSRRADSRDRPGSVSKSLPADKSKQKLPPKKKESKGKDLKEDTKTPKKEKEDTKGASRKEPRGIRGAPANQNAVTGRMSSASAVDATKSQSKTKDKKKERGKFTSDADNADSQDQISPLLDAAEYIDGQLWIAGNRMLINLNLSRNKIGEIGIAAFLQAMQYQ
uniref:Leucine-rich repeat-containing protein 71 n=1 Tax=Arion vulgaris TaxID=1028688 RepID=A0A0B7BKQ4_9EUPU